MVTENTNAQHTSYITPTEFFKAKTQDLTNILMGLDPCLVTKFKLFIDNVPLSNCIEWGALIPSKNPLVVWITANFNNKTYLFAKDAPSTEDTLKLLQKFIARYGLSDCAASQVIESAKGTVAIIELNKGT